ncbi:hypothetical protein FPOAC2_05335 [Fusarium poae]|jgi:hypothetical protein|uniref:hypothetical protein n=1 Tax=Fusarium poae TaxID=36050 RepID=UPI001CE75943|nr:hypothetical protein FPOAC1_005230 [Fusarium poae]KAG8671971.1 hypothetical protein FPOAC1_005230 [Fusarium poae]
MRDQSRAEQQESGNQAQHQNGTEPAQSHQIHPLYEDTYIVPPSQLRMEQDFEYRTNITIQSPQRIWPQEIWYHSPDHRVLYRVHLVLHEKPPHIPPPQDAAPTQNNGGNNHQGGPNGCSA